MPPPPPPQAKREPISLEELMKKKEQEAAAASKPVFLSKKERERLALEKLEAKRRQQEEQQRDAEQARARFRERAYQERRAAQAERYGSRRGRERDTSTSTNSANDNSTTTAKAPSAVDKLKQIGSGNFLSEQGEHIRETTKDQTEQQKELELIRKQYLGDRDRSRKVAKVSERYKFNFDWDASDDTSKDLNPLYQERLQLRPLFGRGFIAGVDAKEQVKKHRVRLEENEKQRKYLSRLASTDATQREREVVQQQLTKLKKDEVELATKALPGIHWSAKTREDMDERDWRIFREDHSIATKGGAIPHPFRAWDEMPLPRALRRAIDSAGYVKPTPIQMQALPIALAGRDVLGVAETGSGKTAAFLLPMMTLIARFPPIAMKDAHEGPYALILAPTRELAQQIEKEAAKLAKHTTIKTVSIVGGQSIDEQSLLLSKGCEIVIATPGRLLDCIENRFLVLNRCSYVVLDEADRMIDMNFEEAINKTLDAMPTSKWKSEDEAIAQEQERIQQQLLLEQDEDDNNDEKRANTPLPQFRTTNLFSATMPSAVERLARKYLRRPATIYIGERGQAVDRIRQELRWCGSEGDKKNVVLELLGMFEPPYILFVNTKRGCDVVARGLDKMGHTCAVLHSGRSQDQRESAIASFKQGKYDCLVATDVAARGLDVKGVTLVINYDLPNGKNALEQYTHRIGRTGRAGATGTAVSLATADDHEFFFDLVSFVRKSPNHMVDKQIADHQSTRVKPVPGQRIREKIKYIK